MRQSHFLTFAEFPCLSPFAPDARNASKRARPAKQFQKYNLVCRSSINEAPQFMKDDCNKSCRGNRYVTTLHVLNSTVVKCSKLTKVSSYPPLSAYCVPTPLLLLLRQGDQGLPRLGAGRASRVVRRRSLEQQTRAPHAYRGCLLALALAPSARIQAALVGSHRRPTASSFCAVCTNLATRPRAHHCLSPRPQLLEAQ